ncbi:hypothetical protein [Kribbella qitaiheensis]|uniref:hypothetical protein n=1 Tax=Kribbella qitaiheensis TaxID=1544730 RepID=UPI0016283871|nr:hypothetical protein [Kribbella qitaiheensis]
MASRANSATTKDADTLPTPGVIPRETVEDLTATLAEFEAVAQRWRAGVNGDP